MQNYYQMHQGDPRRTDGETVSHIIEIGKLLRKPSLAYRMASEEKKVSLVKSLVENFIWQDGKLTTGWKNQYKLIAERTKNTTESGGVLSGKAIQRSTNLF